MPSSDRYAEPTYSETHAQGAPGEPVLREYGGPEVYVPRDGDFVGQLSIEVRSPTTREGDLLTEIERLRQRVLQLRERVAELEARLD